METNNKKCNECKKSSVNFGHPLILLSIYISVTSIYGNFILIKKLIEYFNIIF